VHRIVRDVYDVIAARGPIGQDGSDARNGFDTAVDDAIEVDQQEEAHGSIVAGRLAARTMSRMPPPDRDPLAATQRLLVDGTNLLHSLSRGAGAAPAATLIGRLRAIIPAHVAIELIFDGPPERGLRNERIAAGTSVRYGGARTADAVILSLVDDVRILDGADGTAGLLIVTDDRDLRHGARMRGARTAGSAWLLGRLGSGRLSSPSIGNPRPPRRGGGATGASPATGDGGDDRGDEGESERVGWRPGRGATTKRGNPKRSPKAGGTGRMPR